MQLEKQTNTMKWKDLCWMCVCVVCESSIMEVIFRSSQLLFCISNISVTLSQQDYTGLKLSCVWMLKHSLAVRWGDLFRKTHRQTADRWGFHWRKKDWPEPITEWSLFSGMSDVLQRCSVLWSFAVNEDVSLFCVWWLELLICLKVERPVCERNTFICWCFRTYESNVCQMFRWSSGFRSAGLMLTGL